MREKRERWITSRQTAESKQRASMAIAAYRVTKTAHRGPTLFLVFVPLVFYGVTGTMFCQHCELFGSIRVQSAKREIRQKYNKANLWRRTQRSRSAAFSSTVRIFKFIFHRVAFELAASSLNHPASFIRSEKRKTKRRNQRGSRCG